jgi:hypothetical protein
MTTTADAVSVGGPGNRAKARRLNRWDSPWLNPKFIDRPHGGLDCILMGLIGRLLWVERLSYPASSPLNLPPPWAPGYDDSALAADRQAGGATAATSSATHCSGCFAANRNITDRRQPLRKQSNHRQ